jgi:hypothetical protein
MADKGSGGTVFGALYSRIRGAQEASGKRELSES